jgi:hypothetical protein
MVIPCGSLVSWSLAVNLAVNRRGFRTGNLGGVLAGEASREVVRHARHPQP